MKVKHARTRMLLGVMSAALCAAALSAQSSTPRKGTEANLFMDTPAGWVHPKTAWGDPDIQGTWPISYVGSVSLQRCEGLGGPPGAAPKPCDPNKAFLTDEEYQQALAASKQPDRYSKAVAEGNLGAAFQNGNTDPVVPQRQTSLIVDPPNGRLPEMTEEGKRLSAEMKSSWALTPNETQVWDTYLDFDSWDRCITRGMPASMFPYRYNNGIQIIQAPGEVVINMEMIHETRVIPVDGRPAPSPTIKQWLGISRGHWEGTTLVVETTNLRTGASATNIGVRGAPQGNRFPSSEKMKITERFSRLNNEMMIYQITTEDPVVLTRPWTAKFPLKLDNSYKWWEYACHEGNRTIPDYISASRAERAQAAKDQGPDQ